MQFKGKRVKKGAYDKNQLYDTGPPSTLGRMLMTCLWGCLRLKNGQFRILFHDKSRYSYEHLSLSFPSHFFKFLSIKSILLH